MHELVVVIFPDEGITRRTTDAIKELYAEDSIKVYQSFVVVAKDLGGNLFTLEVTKKGHGATAVGVLVGGLASLPFGLLAMTAGVGGGPLIGYTAELLHEANTMKRFLETWSLAKQRPVVEVKYFAARMEKIDGTVPRK